MTYEKGNINIKNKKIQWSWAENNSEPKEINQKVSKTKIPNKVQKETDLYSSTYLQGYQSGFNVILFKELV